MHIPDLFQFVILFEWNISNKNPEISRKQIGEFEKNKGQVYMPKQL